jgi:uncharacterized protein
MFYLVKKHRTLLFYMILNIIDFKIQFFNYSTRQGILLSLIMVISNLTFSFGQGGDQVLKEKVELIASVNKSSKIMLRWAPNSPLVWKFSNKYGYGVERVTIMREGSLLEAPERKMMTNSPILPLKLDDWESLKEDPNAMVVAQALYGEEFQIKNNSQTDFLQIVNQVKDLEARFSYALFAADQSPDVAFASGLMFTDTTAKNNEKYVYRVFTNIPQNILTVDTGYVFIGLDDYKPLPVPVDVDATFGDKTAIISWNKELFQDMFSYYVVERASDSEKSFKPINDRPLINVEKENKNNDKFAYKLDSLESNDIEYFYRVRGVSPFGEVSEPSDIISGKGIGKAKALPSISSIKFYEEKGLKLKWHLPDSENENIKGFIIEKSLKVKGKFQPVSEKLKPNVREFIDENPKNSYYYRVSAIGNDDTYLSSFPHLVQAIDSIPPLPPIGLKGTIDSLGLVYLKWEKNTESDLLGYRVFRSNYLHEEFSQISKNIFTNSFFVDTLELLTLTKGVYYKLQAVDNNFNNSEFSSIIFIEKPDLIPPVSPVFKNAECTLNGILLEWQISSSSDVKFHVLYRRKKNEVKWQLVDRFVIKDSINSFLDAQVEGNNFYEYTMVAVDESLLESKPSKPIMVKNHQMNNLKKIENVNVKVDRKAKQIELRWSYSDNTASNFLIYKGDENNPIRLYQQGSFNEKAFVDTELQINTVYIYSIKAISSDGRESSLSNLIRVTY